MTLTANDIVLIRCGLLARMDNIKDRPELAASYERSRQLMNMLFPLARDNQGATLEPDSNEAQAPRAR